MAALKVQHLRTTLEAFADLYDRASAAEQAAVLRVLCQSLKKADKLGIKEVVGALKDSRSPALTPRNVSQGH
jgi:hypothetical protein